MLHPYNNSTKKFLSLVSAVAFSGPFWNSLIKAASRSLFVCARRFAP